jgi:hypothetical protein
MDPLKPVDDKISKASADDALADDLRRLYISSSNASGQSGKAVSKPPDVILVVDLNSRFPSAAFIAPSLGHPKCRFLPALQEMSRAREKALTSTEFDPGSSKFDQSGYEWTKDFISHCRRLLQVDLGSPLTDLTVHVSLTSRSDASERDKLKLLEAAERAGFINKTETAIRIVTTIEAATVEAVRRYGYPGLNGSTSRTSGTSTYQLEKLKHGDTILVIYYDGDVAEIQSYSLSFPVTAGDSARSRLQLKETVYGETVDCGKLVDEQFTRWLNESFGNSLEELSANDLGTNGQLMTEFAEVRRNYATKRHDLYSLPLALINPPQSAPYNSSRNLCLVHDSKMRRLFEPAVESLLNSLDSHQARIRKKEKTIDKIIFAGASGICPFLEDNIKDWGIGVGILNTNVVAFPVNVGGYVRFEPR